MNEHQEAPTIEGEVVGLEEFCANNNIVMHIVEDETPTTTLQNNRQSQILRIAFQNNEDDLYNGLEILLNEWGFIHLRGKFSASGYDQIDDLKIITESDLDAMFPNVTEGSQKTRLRAKIIEWRQNNGYKVSVDLLSGSTASMTNSVNKWLELQQSPPTTPQPSSSVLPSRFDLKQFLNTDRGQKIYKCYNSMDPPKLGEYEKKILIESVLEHHYTANLPMTYADFEEISNDIEKTFVGEDRNWYYHREEKRRPTGRLYNKYRNQAPRLRIGHHETPKRLKGLAELEITASKSSSCDYQDEIYERNKEWLGCMNTPWSTVEIKFTETFKGRQQELAKNERNNVEFYKDWVIYLHPDGHRLIDIEFELLHPGKEHCLKQKWSQFENRIIPILKRKIKDKSMIQELDAVFDNNDSKIIPVLKALHFILKPTARAVRKTDKKVWKVSIKNSLDSFITEVGPINNLRALLNKKRETYSSYGMTLQPLILVLENNEYSTCYDEIFYKFHSILDCLTTTFKVHFAFNLNYASESYKVWLFIQKYFFNIETTSDKPDIDISTLIAELTTSENN